MKTAQIAPIAFLATILAIVAALVLPQNAWAASGNVQICQPSSSCTIGEFLYDDSYDPLNTATCRITSRYPDGTSLLSSVVMTVAAESDGWYSYTFTAPSTTGLYRTEVKCTTLDSEVLALDKSFEVKADPTSLSASDVSSAVWSASRASYSTSGSFGEAMQNLIPTSSQIAESTWNYSSRTLSSFGDLISNVWNHSTRSIPGLGSSVSTDMTTLKNDLTSLKKSTNETRLLLEKVVNKPIIQYILEDTESLDLQSKMKKTDTLATQLLTESQYMKSKVGIMSNKWSSLGSSGLAGKISELSNLVGKENDTTGQNSVFSQINWMREQWGFAVVSDLRSKIGDIRQTLVTLQGELEVNGKTSLAARKIKALNSDIDEMVMLIGREKNPSKNTLLGRIAETNNMIAALDSRSAELNKLLSGWNSYSNNDRDKKVQKISKEVLAVNKLPSAKNLLTNAPTNEKPDRRLKNMTLSLQGVLDANKKLLAQKPGRPFSSTWLEEGSIVFKSLITNPSTLVSQTVPLKFYLPQEVKKENVIKIDDGLTVDYDAEKGQYYVAGEFDLAPSESKSVSIEVDDGVFSVSNAEVETLRRQAETLAGPLKNTSYFAQGATLESDIAVSLDKVLSLQKNAFTPEAKIRAYREAQIELDGAKAKIDKLKDLATTAGSTGTLFGFVGGTQTIAVWGLVIIIIAGFVFLTVYMKVLKSQELKLTQASEKHGQDHKEVEDQNREGKPRYRMKTAVKVGVIFIVVGITVAAISSIVYGKIMSATSKNNAPKQVTKVQPQPDDKKTVEKKVEKVEKLIVLVPQGSLVGVYKDPTPTSTVLTSLSSTTSVTKKGDEQQDGWVKVLVQNKEGWVNKEFIDDGTSLEEIDSKEQYVVIDKTLSSYLKVRLIPGGSEIAKVYAGDKLKLIDQTEEWVQVELEDGDLGWVSKDFAKVIGGDDLSYNY